MGGVKVHRVQRVLREFMQSLPTDYNPERPNPSQTLTLKPLSRVNGWGFALSVLVVQGLGLGGFRTRIRIWFLATFRPSPEP